MKAVVAAFNQEKALVGAFSVITNLRMELFQALNITWPLRPKVQVSAPAEDVQTHVDPGHEEEEAGQQPHGGGELVAGDQLN